MSFRRCEVCEQTNNLFSCAENESPVLWFCAAHLKEHRRGAHPHEKAARCAMSEPSEVDLLRGHRLTDERLGTLIRRYAPMSDTHSHEVSLMACELRTLRAAVREDDAILVYVAGELTALNQPDLADELRKVALKLRALVPESDQARGGK